MTLVFTHRYLLICFLIRLISSAVVPSQDSVSLYTANDKVVILTGQNFSSTVYQSKTAWLVEFYASWCGHCQSYANTYREVAIDTWGWRTVVRVGAINCYADENSPICDQHNVAAYPTLRLIGPNSFTNGSKLIHLTATDAKGVERELIKELDALKRTDRNWPNFAPIDHVELENVYSYAPPTVKLVLLIVEKQDDFTGRQIMLDFSKYHEQLSIFRASTDSKLWSQLQLNFTDIPAVFIIHSNGTTERMNTKQNINENLGSRNLLNYAIRSYVHKSKCIDNFDDRDLEEIIHSKNALKKSEVKGTNEVQGAAVENKNLNMVDLETALSYMLRREVPRIKMIYGETYDALLHWLIVLTKYFPGRQPVVTYLKDLLSKVKQQPNGLSGKQFRELADINTSNSYLPNNQIRYIHCTGSAPQYRGYPCALWLLFHTLTVSQVQTESRNTHVTEVPSAIKGFIKHFFGCRHCSDNFMKETSELHQLDANDKNAAVVYLWKVHNHVNERLHGDETEDPQNPKIQFPSSNLCPKCRMGETNFDSASTLDFLLQHYSKDNFDLSSVENPSEPSNKKDQLPSRIDQYSMIEINHDFKQKSGLFSHLTSIVQRFSFYFLIFIVIIVLYVRRRHCKNVMDGVVKFNRRVTRYIKRAMSGSTHFFTDEDEIHRRSSTAGASYNLINSIVGSGVIGMSYAFRQSGYVAGFVLLGIVAVLTANAATLRRNYRKTNQNLIYVLFYDLDYSTTILIRSGHLAKVNTYQELVYTVLGKSGFLWLSLVQFLYPFICLISYNIIIGNEIEIFFISLRFLY
ncbi:unnamed protein product [Adineta ricciae]|uniref:Sulfhydryl oxidase n=1 Tax=Adineta ricciae TaxID=249248 RepID=A0A816CAJ0_ADIRI|nr:unnamed protein product [Adineta ricciae]